jgi:hypothetical protein
MISGAHQAFAGEGANERHLIVFARFGSCAPKRNMNGRKMVVSVSPVRTEEDYAAALKRIDAIFEAKPGTAEFDELDALITLVKAYENEHYPILSSEEEDRASSSPQKVDALRIA